ncbi:transglutaminase domain-containing protein [Candidatus Woesearchaeota archaeon]|nr:transglutaminase domain-containing protein [Candidatus Woesearchaeota archaeon]
MKNSLLLLLLLFAQPLFANPYVAQHLTIGLNISTTISLSPTQARPFLDYAEATAQLFPRDDEGQRVLSWSTTPMASFVNDSYLFRFSAPFAPLLLSLAGTVATVQSYPSLTRRVDFPIAQLPPALEKYLASSEKVNADHPTVLALAAKLAKGETDLFSVVHKLAVFTHNYIRYDPASAGQPRSALWILENKNGVCGDFSSLFLALTRALGIPSRYVTGVAYSTYRGANKFVPHAWTEVYFPGYGWVPFDPTYGEYGYVDPTHVKLKVSADVDGPSFSYAWKGDGYDLTSGDISIDAHVLNQGNPAYPVLLDANVEHSITGLGSDNHIIIMLNNTLPYFIAEDVTIAAPPEVFFSPNETRHVLLAPRELRTLFWKFHVPSLPPQYKYTFPVMVYTARNQSVSLLVGARAGEEVFSVNEESNVSEVELVIPPPQMTLSNVTAPKMVVGNGPFSVSFVLEKHVPFPLNVTVRLGPHVFSYPAFAGNRQVLVKNLRPSSFLRKNEVVISIILTATNREGLQKQQTYTLKIPYRPLSLWERIVRFFQKR